MVVTAFRIPQSALINLFFNIPLFYFNFFFFCLLMNFCLFFLLDQQNFFRIFFKIVNSYACNTNEISLNELWISDSLLMEREYITERVIILSIVCAYHTYSFDKRFIYHRISHPTTSHTWEKPARKFWSKTLSA